MQMLRNLRGWSVALMAIALTLPIIAQEGHPLKGSWIGAWASNPKGEDVVMVMNWDGKSVSGIINPGTDDIKIDNATLDPNGWKVHIDASGKDAKGATVKYTIDGAIDKLEMPNRGIIGTWSSGTSKGKFEAHRQ